MLARLGSLVFRGHGRACNRCRRLRSRPIAGVRALHRFAGHHRGRASLGMTSSSTKRRTRLRSPATSPAIPTAIT